jgi:uncharacterized membrane protein
MGRHERLHKLRAMLGGAAASTLAVCSARVETSAASTARGRLTARNIPAQRPALGRVASQQRLRIQNFRVGVR